MPTAARRWRAALAVLAVLAPLAAAVLAGVLAGLFDESLRLQTLITWALALAVGLGVVVAVENRRTRRLLAGGVALFALSPFGVVKICALGAECFRDAPGLAIRILGTDVWLTASSRPWGFPKFVVEVPCACPFPFNLSALALSGLLVGAAAWRWDAPPFAPAAPDSTGDRP